MSAAGPHRAVLSLSVRLVHRGALALAGAGYVALEVASDERTYPTA